MTYIAAVRFWQGENDGGDAGMQRNENRNEQKRFPILSIYSFLYIPRSDYSSLGGNP
jgi:hypothetical protein